ncbi:MAG: metallophosphoesterase [Clostridia bacterium]|nr:metallophosphoesterase [Clostridia bacterium]
MLKIKVFFKQIAALFLTFSMTVAPLFGVIRQGGKSAFFDNWSASDAFTADCAVRMDKQPDKDFVILNLTDIQLNNAEAFNEVGAQTKAVIDRLVADTKPDLITVTGDNGSMFLAYNEMIRMLDSYGIPWAPIMGNHDGHGFPGEFWCAYNFADAKNCLFRFGPADMGYGNYIIHIYENDQIIHTLYMMDTHDNIEADNCNGPKGDGYDHLWENQMLWYAWAVNGTNKLAGKAVDSSVFFHIPLCEYNSAWNAATEDGKFKAEYAETSFGEKREGVCCAPENNGFFMLMQRLGSTKNVICGHDHVNSFSILYEGIRLTYSLKTGAGAYSDADMNGGTTLTIASDGSTTTVHHYVDAASLTV